MFEVRYGREAAQADNAVDWVVRQDCATCHTGFLIDTETNMIVASDIGHEYAPEDMCFGRDLDVFVDLLNQERELRKLYQQKADAYRQELLEVSEYL